MARPKGPESTAIVVLIPDALRKRLDAEVRALREGNPYITLSDLVRETLSLGLDCYDDEESK